MSIGLMACGRTSIGVRSSDPWKNSMESGNITIRCFSTRANRGGFPDQICSEVGEAGIH